MLSPCRAALTAAFVVALLPGCSSGAEPSASPSGAGPPGTAGPLGRASSSPGETPTAVTSPPPTAAAVRVLAVRFAGGQVTGVEPRVTVARGEQVVLRVSSDVSDEVHVHGYDLRQKVDAGGTAEIALTADLPGGFEVELEELGRTLFQLRVS